LYDDPYNRDVNRLMVSLAAFGSMIADGKLCINNEDLRKLSPILYRYCDNQITLGDMKILLSTYPPLSRTKKRHIFTPQILDWQPPALISALVNLSQYEEGIFLHRVSPQDWIVFLVFTRKPRIELFVVGDIDTKETIEKMNKLQKIMEKLLPNEEVHCFYRFKFPQIPLLDNGSATFVLVHYLYQHGNYNVLDANIVCRYKLSVISSIHHEELNYILCHDNWFGYLRPMPGPRPWHPFVVSVTDGTEEFKEDLDKNGWIVFDVDGDGNCGFYCFILGLENHSNYSYSVNKKTLPMTKNKPWQKNVVRMRRHLAQKSRRLTESEFSDGIFLEDDDSDMTYRYPWLQYTCAVSNEDFFGLSDYFVTDQLKQADYFNGTLTENSDFFDYMMHPYWGALVFSYSFQIRVVIYTRTTSYTSTSTVINKNEMKLPEEPKDNQRIYVEKKIGANGEEQEVLITETFMYSWSTHIVDHSVNIQERIVTIEGLSRMSDEEIRRSPTIEMVYTNGFLGKGREEDKHFQFLRRGYFLFGSNGDSSNETEQSLNHQSVIEPATTLLTEKLTNNQSTVEPPRKKSQFESPPIDSFVAKQTTVEPTKKKSQLEQPRNLTPAAEQSITIPQTFTDHKPTVERHNNKSRKEPSHSEPIVTEQPTIATTATPILADKEQQRKDSTVTGKESTIEGPTQKSQMEQLRNQSVVTDQSTTIPKPLTNSQPTVELPKKKSRKVSSRNTQPIVERPTKKSRKEPSHGEPIVTGQQTVATTATDISAAKVSPRNDFVVTDQVSLVSPKNKSQTELPRNHSAMTDQSTLTPKMFTNTQSTVEPTKQKARKDSSRSEPIVTEQPTAATMASNIKDVRPLQCRRRLGKSYSRQEKGTIKLNIQSFFNQQVIDGQISSEELMYDPIKQLFRSRQIFKNGRRGDSIVCTTMDAYPPSLINAATEFPKEWIGPSISTTECPLKPKATASANPPPKLTKSLVDTRPTNARKGTSNPRYVSWKIHCYFNKLRREKRLDASQLKYMPSEDVFYVRTPDTAGRLGPVFPCHYIDEFDDNLILSAKEFPGRWMGPTIGDTNYEVPPDHLLTTVPTIYQQFKKRHCLTHSLASALFYCQLEFAAKLMASQGVVFSQKQFGDAIVELRSFMQNIAPCIGTPTIYGIRTNTHSRKKRTLEWDDLFTKLTRYPTLVIPVLPDGSTNHAFCVVDDLIFDSTVPYAMKLTWESVKWICRGFDSKIYCALRFETKFSPKGVRTKEIYQHQIQYHWDGSGTNIDMEF
jgi:hypothetical protein